MSELSFIIEKQFPRARLEAIRAVSSLAAGQGLRVYLVGGVVRDLLLGRPTEDIDLVVEGDTLALARTLAIADGWQVATYQRFGTAKLQREGITLDVATAREETYSKPGALPQVKPGTIQDDLRRRDFTINALALEVTSSHFGEILDLFGGQEDLLHGLIRILHPRSFVDDPTRVFRAIRYEQRLDFRLEPETESLLRSGLPGLSQVSGDRVRHELELVLKEDVPEKALRRAADLGVLSEVHPGLEGNGWLAQRFEEARRRGWASAGLYLALLTYRLEEVETFISRLKISRVISSVLRDTHGLKEASSGLAKDAMRPSAIYGLLKGYSQTAIHACILASDESIVRERLTLYLDKMRYVKPRLAGDDLLKLGVPKGEQVGKMLERLRSARLDGELDTAEQETALVRNWVGT